MKKFFKKNWLRIGLAFFTVSLIFFTIWHLNNKKINFDNEKSLNNKKNEDLSKIEDEIRAYEKLIEIKNNEQTTLTNQVEIIDNQINQTKLEIEKLRLEGANNEKIKEEQNHLEEWQDKKEKLISEVQEEENRYQEVLKKVEEEKQRYELSDFEDMENQNASNFLPQQQVKTEKQEEDPQIKIEKCKITAKQQAGEKIGKYKAKNKMPTSDDYWDCVTKYDPTKDTGSQGIPISKKVLSNQQACQKESEILMDQFKIEVEIVYSQYYDKYYSDCLSE